MLKIATAFSGGLAAFEFAFKYEDIPHEIVFACEWDNYARKQYIKFHGKPNKFYNDIKELSAIKYKHNIDLFVWGSPCQDLSLSGKREGLKGSKSSHFWHGLRVQSEIMPKVFVFENVPGLLSSNGGADYKTVCNEFRNQGYHIHTSKLNAKDFEDPQNRDRIFIIGFLDVNAYHRYKTPEKIPLELRLKDVLQKWVPEKYFLSQKMIDGFIAHKERHQERGNGFGFKPTEGNKVAATLQTATGSRPTDDFIKVELNQIGNIDQKGHNSLWGRVYDTKGIGTCLNANGGGAGAKTGLYLINSNTKSGYETAKDYDCINLSRPTSTTRRGRVGKGYAQTLECGGNIGVIYNFMIRRLTPYETFRLQGLKDEDIKLIVSDTQAYKISGNAINVSVARAILKALYKKDNNKKTSIFDFDFT
jgi:DNA (cytosine-5)-methyltransferase 1